MHQAANTVAAHFGLRAIGVVDTHADRGLHRGFCDDHSIGAHTLKTVAKDGHMGPVEVVISIINQDKVVTAT